MSRPLKRQRTSAPRPISKTLLHFNSVLADGSSSETLFTSTFPCTVTGLRWDLGSPATPETPQTAFSNIQWVIVLVKEGNTANDISFSAAINTLYNPEQNVLASGYGLMGDPFKPSWHGTTKTMRKMQTGDSLVIVFAPGTTPSANAFFGGIIQFFCKS